jgi:hypothetical protein
VNHPARESLAPTAIAAEIALIVEKEKPARRERWQSAINDFCYWALRPVVRSQLHSVGEKHA